MDRERGNASHASETPTRRKNADVGRAVLLGGSIGNCSSILRQHLTVVHLQRFSLLPLQHTWLL